MTLRALLACRCAGSRFAPLYILLGIAGCASRTGAFDAWIAQPIAGTNVRLNDCDSPDWSRTMIADAMPKPPAEVIAL